MRVALVFICFSMACISQPRDMLAMAEKRVDEAFSVPEVDYPTLREALARKEQFILFDVREPDEFRVSHLEGAIQLDPETTAEAFEQNHGDAIRGKHLVFYCSVGYRSSKMAERVLAGAIQKGALSVRNLRGGAFRWYNEGLPMVDEQGPTGEIHPYDAIWGKLLIERSRKDEQ